MPSREKTLGILGYGDVTLQSDFKVMTISGMVEKTLNLFTELLTPKSTVRLSFDHILKFLQQLQTIQSALGLPQTQYEVGSFLNVPFVKIKSLENMTVELSIADKREKLNSKLKTAIFTNNQPNGYATFVNDADINDLYAAHCQVADTTESLYFIPRSDSKIIPTEHGLSTMYQLGELSVVNRELVLVIANSDKAALIKANWKSVDIHGQENVEGDDPIESAPITLNNTTVESTVATLQDIESSVNFTPNVVTTDQPVQAANATKGKGKGK